MPHALLTGETGSGKTNLALLMLMAAAIRRLKWIVAVFPHRQAGIDFIAELYAMFGEMIFRFLIVEDLSDFSGVIMRSYIPRSVATCPWKRENENDLYARAIQDMTFTRRTDIKDLGDHPVLDVGTYNSFRIFQELDTWVPDSLVSYCLKPKEPEFHYIYNHLPDKKLRRYMDTVRLMPPTAWTKEIYPAARALDLFFNSPPIRARATKPARFDDEAFYNAGGIKVILGGGISDPALQTHVHSDFHRTVGLIHKGLKRSGIYLIDEVLNYFLWGKSQARATATLRGINNGVDIVGITQILDFPNEDIGRKTLGNTDHYWFVNGDPETVDIATYDCRGGLDPDKIAYYRKRQVNLGMQEVPRISTSVTTLADGKKTESTQTGTQLIPIIGFEEEPVIQGTSDQLNYLAGSIMNQPVGTCTVRKMGRRPFQFDVPLFPDSWILPGLAKAKAEECLARIKTSRIYQKPEIFEVPEVIEDSGGNGHARPSQSFLDIPVPQGSSSNGRNGRQSKKRGNGSAGYEKRKG